MQIRSVTCGLNIGFPVRREILESVGEFGRAAREAFAAVSLPPQTVRLATQPFPDILAGQPVEKAVDLAVRLEELCRQYGLDYCSLGPVMADMPGADLSWIEAIPQLIRRTEVAFASVFVASRQNGISLAAIERTAGAIKEIAETTENGFGNLRLAALANCPAGSPFFPVSFHKGEEPTFAIATEAADLAVTAFSEAEGLAEARVSLTQAVEEAGRVMAATARRLEARYGFRFGGIDFSLAPFPEEARSIGTAIERLGVDRFGASGTLLAAAFITDILEKADFPRCGFSGLMLPLLEDATIARRSEENLYTLDSLLLYSAVCGAGLDTIPLPGGVSVDELAAILLDMAVLAVRLDKPLTARLMPIPGKEAGERTDFDFPYFANARIMDVKGRGSEKIFRSNAFIAFN